ncbi:MAG: glycosyltransferase [Candidatus Pacebacteria bacterium]|nr:glycosyltransferase [Candidatus Paceibacterota bacterium]
MPSPLIKQTEDKPLPLVTVLMPVYNCEKFLKEAMQSVLDQTYENIEFLIIEDGSADRTSNVISSFSDPRIKVICHEKNEGLIRSLNEGLRIASGAYIARMDGDDKMLPNRIREQVEYMEKNTRVGICGTWIRILGTNSIGRYRAKKDETRARLLFNSPLAHPSVILRTKLFRDKNLTYSLAFPHAEDYELWTRVILHAEIVNIPKVLLLYRRHESQVSKLYRDDQIESTLKASLNLLATYNIRPDEDEMGIQKFIVSGYDTRYRPSDFKDLEDWLMSLYKCVIANNHNSLSPKTVKNEIERIWIESFLSIRKPGLKLWKEYVCSPLSGNPIRNQLQYKLLLKSLLKI